MLAKRRGQTGKSGRRLIRFTARDAVQQERFIVRTCFECFGV
jgi:hypothetical protein